jgi:two-component system, sensor histidine kinase PdtaS
MRRSHRRGDDHSDRWAIGRGKRSSPTPPSGSAGRKNRNEVRGRSEPSPRGHGAHSSDNASVTINFDLSTLPILAGEVSQEASDHVLRLLGSWGVLSDLSFSDLILVTPQKTDVGVEIEVIGQKRPATSATLVRSDMVGRNLHPKEWPAVTRALVEGHVELGRANLALFNPLVLSSAGEGETGEVPAIAEEASLECVPVRCGEDVVAVLVRISTAEKRRPPGRLEKTYQQAYDRLVAMVAAGSYPFGGEVTPSEDVPRVGDGFMMIDTGGNIRFASPNAMSALHRMGVNSSVDGHTLNDLEVEEGAVALALSSGKPVIEEVERRPDVIVLVHCIPLLEGERVTGGMVLLRDVTDLRRLDRLLLTKDAAIREVHHRVKNNLQTISSLLRLQARRLDPGEAQQALKEAERRVRSIALVHEILSRDPGEEVPFSDIVESLVRMAQDSVVGVGEIDITVDGDLGEVTAMVATPLALVLAELLQNAIEHGFPDSTEGTVTPEDPDAAVAGHVQLVLDSEGPSLRIQVRDDGVGLSDDFDVKSTSSLGLSIVRDLVESQLGGTMSMTSNQGTVVDITVLSDPSTSDRAW